jgi:tetratricopeptide (TPR) repeat protein
MTLALCACQAFNTAGTNQGAGGVASPTSNIGAASGQPAELDDEIARLEREAEKDPDDDVTRTSLAQAYYLRGSALQQSGKLDEAMSDFQNALRFDPAHEEANIRLAQITREKEPDPRADDGKPVAIPATPGPNSNNK